MRWSGAHFTGQYSLLVTRLPKSRIMDHRMTGLTGPQRVPEGQGGMLAPPFMDHRMTSELGLIRTNCQTHARHGVKHCSSGNGLRQMILGWHIPRGSGHRKCTVLGPP